MSAVHLNQLLYGCPINSPSYIYNVKISLLLSEKITKLQDLLINLTILIINQKASISSKK